MSRRVVVRRRRPKDSTPVVYGMDLASGPDQTVTTVVHDGRTAPPVEPDAHRGVYVTLTDMAVRGHPELYEFLLEAEGMTYDTGTGAFRTRKVSVALLLQGMVYSDPDYRERICTRLRLAFGAERIFDPGRLMAHLGL